MMANSDVEVIVVGGGAAGVAAAFRQAGLDPMHPHLEPGSMDDYSLASPDESVRAIRTRQRPMRAGKCNGGRRARQP